MRPAPSPLRALRVGVVLGDTVIDERTLRAPATFSLGRTLRNTVAIPVPGLPRSWPLLTMTEHGVLVRLAADMDLRVHKGETVLTRADLEAGATRHRDHVSVVVRPGGHGKVQLGEVRVLFQEVTLPPPSPRPVLPRAVRGTLADRIDGRLAAFAAVSILGHAGLMVAAHYHDVPDDGLAERAAQASYVPETIAIIDADDLPAIPTPAPEPSPEPGAIATPTPTPEPGRTPTPVPGRTPRPPRTDGPVGLPAADPTRYADALFGEDGLGDRAGDMARRQPSSELGKQLQELADQNAKASIGGDQGGRIRDGGGPELGTVTEPVLPAGPGGPVKVDPDKTEQVPPTRITITKPPPPPGGGDVAHIVRKIGTTYLASLQRCYKRTLAGDPTLAGKITLTFTVTEKGGVSEARASGLDPQLESCVEGLMPQWSFTPVVDDDGDATEVDLKLALQLTPT